MSKPHAKFREEIEKICLLCELNAAEAEELSYQYPDMALIYSRQAATYNLIHGKLKRALDMNLAVDRDI